MGYSNKKLRSKSKSRLRSRSTLRSKRNKKTKGGSLPGLEGDTLTLTKAILDSNPNFKSSKSISIKTIMADETVTEIPDGLFGDAFERYFHSLKTVNFSKAKNLTVIGIDAFLKCKNLEKVILPEEISVDNCPFVIKYRAFSGCINLSEIIFPPTKNILIPYETTFYKCLNLKKITFKVTPINFKIIINRKGSRDRKFDGSRGVRTEPDPDPEYCAVFVGDSEEDVSAEEPYVDIVKQYTKKCSKIYVKSECRSDKYKHKCKWRRVSEGSYEICMER